MHFFLLILTLLLSISTVTRAQVAFPLKYDFRGPDKNRKKIKINFKPIGSGFNQPTDIQFVPGTKSYALVLEKNGAVKWFHSGNGQKGTLLRLDVATSSEAGVLGVAFHSKFKQNRLLYLNYVVKESKDALTRVVEYKWRRKKPLEEGALEKKRVILQIKQPYMNHNAGQLAFGPNGYLYIGLGDGGWAGDPEGNGQNTKTLLGSMLRIDVDLGEDGKNYRIPKDNPFVGNKSILDEIWAYGLRNPWRYSFDPEGRLIVGDVGQNKFEEISIIERGGNYGWAVFEADDCYGSESKCKALRSEAKMPVYSYPASEGKSITGGYVYYGKSIPALRGKYVFCDFVSKRFWAIKLPDDPDDKVSPKGVYALGFWDISVATFGQDHFGELYAAEFNKGIIYKLIKR